MIRLAAVVFALFSSILLGIEKKTFNAHNVSETIKIDGILSEDLYKQINPLSGFTQYHPKNGEKATFETEVYCFYDKHNIYFAFKCFDSNPEKISGDITSFGEFENNDEVDVYIDTFIDKQTYEVFSVNPKGIKSGKETIWDADAKIDKSGWSAEIKIPFKSLRFPLEKVQHWTVNFSRKIPRLNETDYWCPVDRNKVNTLGDTFGFLEGIKEIKGGKNIEVFPYAAIRNSHDLNTKENKAAYGLDLKYGITSNLTLDFTSSPDYSEVESDPFFYQLDPYEVVLDEKRPFYLEGQSYFATDFNLFYSRRIKNPTLAFKISGKESGNSIGLLAANNQLDENNEFYGVLRYKRDIFSLSTIGIIYSSIEDKGYWNRNIGLDFNLVFKNIYSLKGMAAFSFNKDMSNSNNGMFELFFGRYVGRGFSFSGSYKRIDPSVYVPAGYIPKVDYQNFTGFVSYAFLWEGNWLEELLLRLWKINEYCLSTDLKTVDTYMLGLTLFTKDQISLNSFYKFGKARPSIFNQDNKLVYGDIFDRQGCTFNVNYKGSRWIEIESTFDFLKGYVYNNEYTESKKGTTTDLSLTFTLKISPQIKLILDGSNYKYHSEDWEISFNGSLFSTAINYQLNKNITAYANLQYDSYEKRYQYDLILGYELAALSKVYFSIKNYSENHFGFLHSDIRSISFKLSYLLRI
jgi:hypothetical protein